VASVVRSITVGIMPSYDWITLTTDYGLSDGFVAACHGVIGRIAPAIRVIDVTHLVPPGGVSRGAAVLAQAVPHLPDAVHIAVVDPGVGTARRGVAIEAGGAVLIGPDNGLLPAAARALGGARRAVQLTNTAWFSASVSPTFHGRDIFAPVAGRIATGAKLRDAGPELDPDTLVRLPDPVVLTGAGYLEAEVSSVDRFGNVQLAATGELLDQLGARLMAGGVHAIKGRTFAEAAPGALVAYVDSAGYVALAINGGRAVVALAVSAGDLVRIANDADA
jgi:S-adenosyl-L-methionine hydrolase (adenosine-forming)